MIIRTINLLIHIQIQNTIFLKYCVYYEKQFNYKSICLVISNLYLEMKHKFTENNHFVSSIIEKIIQAKLKEKKDKILW